MVKEGLKIVGKKNEIVPTELSFEDLRGAYELVNTTFREVENGFECVNGDSLIIWERNGVYKLAGLPQNRQNFHHYVLLDKGEIFRNGTTNKKEIIKAIRLMITETGNRIIK